MIEAEGRIVLQYCIFKGVHANIIALFVIHIKMPAEVPLLLNCVSKNPFLSKQMA